MVDEQMLFMDSREHGGGLLLEFTSDEPLRHRQFDTECREAMCRYALEIVGVRLRKQSIVNLITDSRDIAENVSDDIASRMALRLESE